MTNIKLSIIVPVWNQWHFTENCIKDLLFLPEDHEIIIVDDASTDDTPTKILKYCDRIKYIRSPNNGGFAVSCNLGYSHSSGNYVMFLNNDIKVKEDKSNWTEPLFEKAATHIVGPTGGLLNDNLNFVAEIEKLVDNPYFYMSGWNVTSSKDNWRKLCLPGDLGPFSTEYGKAYYEDTDLSFRARELGIPFDIISVPVKHFGKQTTKTINTSMLYLQAKEKFTKKWSQRILKKG
ncbi:MAG TPA: glycosyltransferase [Candidatus Babeliales bacterium]|nr:glycosyltransferase [Candidatus Babeliales bacterium]